MRPRWSTVLIAAALIFSGGCELSAKPEPESLLSIDVRVPDKAGVPLVTALRKFAADHRFAVKESRTPETEELALLSGITSVTLTKGEERISMVNADPDSRQDYTVTIATYKTSAEATATLQRRAALLKAYLNREGLVTGKEELHLWAQQR